MISEKAVNTAKDLYLTLDETGNRKYSNVEISKIITKKLRKKITEGTL